MIQFPKFQATTYALAFKALILNLTNSESLATLGMNYFNQCNELPLFQAIIEAKNKGPKPLFLNQSSLCKRNAGFTNNDVVEHWYVDTRQALLNLLGDANVGL